jgi:hypothetical protein
MTTEFADRLEPKNRFMSQILRILPTYSALIPLRHLSCLTTALWLAFALFAGGCAEPAESLATPDGKSVDLPSDLALMWETKPLHSNKNARASSDRAIHAAERVFKTVDLMGKTRDEVLQTLGSPKDKSDSMYNFPFYSADPSVMVFRFDNGAWGAQYNLSFDESGRVTKVEPLMIE